MKCISVAWLMASAVWLTACAPMQPNPQFRDCANGCTKRQDVCMVNASTGNEVSRCHAGLDACITSCEQRFPRYLAPR